MSRKPEGLGLSQGWYAFGLASAAVKRRKAGARLCLIRRAAAPSCIDQRQRLLMLRGQWLDCAFRRFASPFIRRGRIHFWIVASWWWA